MYPSTYGYDGSSYKKHSSSSSSSGDDAEKVWKKAQKKQKKQMKKQGYYPGPTPGYPGGMPAPGPVYPPPPYPPQPGYPQGYPPAPYPQPGPPGGYPVGAGAAVGSQHYPGEYHSGHGSAPYPPQPGLGYPGQPAPGPGYPGQPNMTSGPGYPGQPGIGPSPGYPGQPGPGYPNQPGMGPGPGYPGMGPGPGYPGMGPGPGQPGMGPGPGYPGMGPGPGYPGMGPGPGQPGMGPGPGQPNMGPGPGYPGQPGMGPTAGYPGQPGMAPGPGAYSGQPAGPNPGLGPMPGQPQAHNPSAPPQPAPASHGPTAPAGASSVNVHKVVDEFSHMKLYGTAEKLIPTVTPAKPFNAEADTKVLRKAMKGMGTDEKAIIGVLGHRSNLQRLEIKKMFKTMYGKDLMKDLQSELSGDLREVIMAMFMPPAYYDAWSLHNAMAGIGTKDAVLIEILCTRTNAQIRDIVQSYKEQFGKDLESHIAKDTSGHYKRLLISCCQGNRAELTEEQMHKVLEAGGCGDCVVDKEIAKHDAEELLKAGEKKLGTDESAFLSIMATRNYYQLRATFDEYAKLAGKDILKSVGSEMSGDLEDAFKAIVMSVRNRPEFFADKLFRSMKRAGTDDHTLIRVIVTRSEVDLGNAKEIFQKKYGKSLAKMVESETGGDYRRLLLAVIGS